MVETQTMQQTVFIHSHLAPATLTQSNTFKVNKKISFIEHDFAKKKITPKPKKVPKKTPKKLPVNVPVIPTFVISSKGTDVAPNVQPFATKIVAIAPYSKPCDDRVRQQQVTIFKFNPCNTCIVYEPNNMLNLDQITCKFFVSGCCCKEHIDFDTVSKIVNIPCLNMLVPKLNNWDRLDFEHISIIANGDMLNSTIINSFIQLFANLNPKFGYISSHVMTIPNLNRIVADTSLLVSQLSNYCLDDMQNIPGLHSNAKIVFMPLFGDVHWMLAIWYKEERRIEVFDSFASQNRVFSWKSHLIAFCQRFVPGEYTFVFGNPNCCMQRNDVVNCGVFVLYFVWKVAQNSPSTLLPTDKNCNSTFMKEWRKPLAAVASYIHLLQQVCVPSPKKLFGNLRQHFKDKRATAISTMLK